MDEEEEGDPGRYATFLGGVEEQVERIAVFRRIIFHAHSPDSHDWAEDAAADPERNSKERLTGDSGDDEFLDEVARHYDIVCVTDHMKSGYATRLASKALRRSDIVVFPGMEINCLVAPSFADAVHLLAVFPPETSEVGIERVFQGKDLVDPCDRNGSETVRFDDLKQLRDVIHGEGGIFILAHVENQTRGHRARYRTDRARTLAIYGDEKATTEELPAEYRVHLSQLLPDAVELQHVEDQSHYASFEADGDTHEVTCVGPADHHSFEDYERAEMATLIKVPNLDFDSVVAALKFRRTRIRLPGEASDHTGPRIIGIKLASPSGDGLFQDDVVAFSRNLNCLIGPRGSGKSTLIEALRYVLGRNAELLREGSGATTFADLARNTQRANLNGTRIELIYENGTDQTVLSAAFDEDEASTTRAFDLEGNDLRIGQEAVAEDFPVAIFSWSEMEVLGREASRQRDLVDRLLGVSSATDVRREILERMEKNRQDVGAIVDRLNEMRSANGGRLGRFRQFREAYEAINTPAATELFSDLDEARKRTSLVDELITLVETCESKVRDLEGSQIEVSLSSAIAAADESVREWWESNYQGDLRVQELSKQISETTAQLRREIDELSAGLARAAAATSEDSQRVEAELRSNTHLDDERDLLRDQREIARTRFDEVSMDRQGYLEKLAELNESLERRSQMATELSAARRAISESRQVELSSLNERLGDLGGTDIQISVDREALSDRDAAKEFIEDALLTRENAGNYMNRQIAQRLATMAAPEVLAAALTARDVNLLGADAAVGSDGALDLEEAEKLVAGYEWRQADDDAEIDLVDPRLLKIIELAEQPIDDRVSISLNGKPVASLSPGQRSSAMLPLIALAEDNPLIIDQPEDNLDNAMVGKILTRILADLKEQRQIIVATHNPNIVVGGDAEQVVVLDAPEARRASVAGTGSIDDPGTIASVLRIMEGGKEAFESRSRRYGLS